jgi:iron complex outermembrane receptor protein
MGYVTKLFVVFLLGMAVSLSPAGAAETETKEKSDDSKMEEILVTPRGKIADEVTTAPAVVETRTAEEIKRINKVESSDVFRYMPDVYVRKVTPGSTNRPMAIRANPAFMTARTLVLMDGIRISDFMAAGNSNGPKWQAVAPDEIERVDLIYGPFSAAHSGNSLGGTALISTRYPQKREMSIDAGYTYQRAKEYKTREDMHGYNVHATYGDKIGPFSLMFWYDRLETEVQPITYMTQLASSGGAATGNAASGQATDLDPQGNQRYIFGSTGTTYVVNNTAKLKLAYDLPYDSQLRFNFVFWDSTQDNDSPDTYLRNAAGEPIYSGSFDINGRSYTISPSTFYYQNAEKQDMLYALSYSRNPAGGLKLSADLSYYDIFQDLTRKSTTAPPLSKSGGAGTVGDNGGGWYTADLKGSHDIAWLGKHAITAGYHYDQYIVVAETWNASDWKNDTRTTLSKGEKGKTGTHAIFLEENWDIIPQLAIYLGGRYEWWKGFDGSKSRDIAGGRVTTGLPDKSHDDFSPKFAVTCRPTQDWSFRYSLGIANRYPTVGELFYGGINSSGIISTPNPDLKPEHAFAQDFTITRTLWGYGDTRLSFFQNDVKDAINSQTNFYTNVTNFQNVDKVRTRGIEYVLDIRKLPLEGLGLSANASWAEAKILKNESVPASVGKIFPRVPKWRAKFTVDYAPTERWFVAFSGNYAGKMYNKLDNSDTEGGYGALDDYLVFDARAYWKVTEKLTASVGIDNLTDVLYHESHPYPRRTVFSNLKYTF